MIENQETVLLILQLVLLPIIWFLAVRVFDHSSRIKAMESNHLTYREFMETINPINERLLAIAIRLGVEEERRRDNE